MPGSVLAWSALPSADSEISTIPRLVFDSIRPGVTVLPAASTTVAPAGTGTLAPTAAILPPRSTSVPRSIVDPVAVMMRALVIAMVSPAGACGASLAGAGFDGTGCCAAGLGFSTPPCWAMRLGAPAMPSARTAAVAKRFIAHLRRRAADR